MTKKRKKKTRAGNTVAVSHILFEKHIYASRESKSVLPTEQNICLFWKHIFFAARTQIYASRESIISFSFSSSTAVPLMEAKSCLRKKQIYEKKSHNFFL